MSPTPAVEFLVTAILPMTLCPGSSPPSPGLAPYAAERKPKEFKSIFKHQKIGMWRQLIPQSRKFKR